MNILEAIKQIPVLVIVGEEKRAVHCHDTGVISFFPNFLSCHEVERIEHSSSRSVNYTSKALLLIT